MTTAEQEPGTVRVLRPVGGRLVAAGLAVAAAVSGLLSLGLSLDTVRATEDVGDWSVTVYSYGEFVTGLDEPQTTVQWLGPVVLAVVLLAGAAVAAVLGARTDAPGPWSTAAQQLALGATGLLAAVTAVVVAYGWADVSVYERQEGLVTRWGPAPVALAAGTLLALAAALTARRGRAAVLATLGGAR
ncbi:hypothetical protein [Blastococcus sp. SYSU D00820]